MHLLRAALACAVLLSTSAAFGWPSLSSPPVQGGGANDAALIVGIEDYVSAPDVPGALQNADDWATYLTRARRVPAANVRVLRNSEATLERMRKQAAETASSAKPGGTLWFVFVGHGAPSQSGNDGVLVGADAQQDPDSLYARSLPQSELLQLLGKGAQARTVAVVDACFSGRTQSGAPLVKGIQPLIALKAAPLKVANALVFTAARADQFAGELPSASRPAFSYLMLGALRGWADRNGDAVVTAQEALDYTKGTLGSVLKDRSQTPELFAKNPAEQLAFAAAEPPPDPSASAAQPDRAPRSPADGARPKFFFTTTTSKQTDWTLAACDNSLQLIPGLSLAVKVDRPGTLDIDSSLIVGVDRANLATWMQLFLDGQPVKDQAGSTILGGCRAPETATGDWSTWCQATIPWQQHVEPGLHTLDVRAQCNGLHRDNAHGWISTGTLRATLWPD